MAIVCPHCRHSMSAKDAKAGSYKPKCAKCGKRFALTIFADPAQPPRVAQLADVTAADCPVNATVPPVPPTLSKTKTQAGSVDATLAPPADPPPAATVAPAVDATSAWSPTASAQVTAPQRAVEVTQAAVAQPAIRTGDASLPGSVPTQINGYKLVRELGRGAMGAVYLARQNSLDREVALKTIQAQWARNPAFIARFTREAYAAAQLTHHNVVQIHDLGVDGDINFFSMEFVRGTSLDELVKQHGKLDVDAAVGYTLQAARGLEFAHNHGMVHRDVKPANLMLNEHGIVKVADLGLVKTPQPGEDEAADLEGGPASGRPAVGSSLAAADVTLANMAMGTPAYMAPEQSQNAAGVDHRADIYSLGCTLYVLLTGRPPFEGASALEVITKHRTEPVVRPEAIVKRVPKELSEIVLKMVAKQPGDRYANLGQVIKALESFLGIQATGAFLAKEDQVQTVEDCAAKFRAAGAARLRAPLVLAFCLFVVALFLAGLVWSWPLAAGAIAMGAAAIASYFAVSGWRERTHLFGKCRELLSKARWTDWATWLAFGLLGMVVLLVLGWLGMAVGMSLVGVLLGLAFYLWVDRKLASQRHEPVRQVEQLLKSARIKGTDEAALQQFVCKYSGEHWEEFFESLFGYEAKIAARQAWGRSDKGRERPRFRAWRETVVRWIDRRVQASREERDRKHLQQVEEKGLQAQGIDLITARKQAQRMAEALVDEAAETRAAVGHSVKPTVLDPKLEAAKKRAKIKTMLADAKSGAYQAKRRRMTGTMLSPLTVALGGKMRFLLGCLMLIGWGLWARQNDLLTRENAEQVGSAVKSSVQQGDAAGLAKGAQAAASQSMKPLSFPLVGPLLSSFNAGVAGLVLVVLGLFRGWKMSLFALPAAALMVLGPTLGIPSLSPWASLHLGGLAIGLLVAGVGLLLGRTSG